MRMIILSLTNMKRMIQLNQLQSILIILTLKEMIMIKSDEKIFGSCFRSISHILYYMNDEKLKMMGITNQQGKLLRLIYDNILAGNSISRHFLEETMDLRGPTVTSLLNSLEKKGYIFRTVSNEDHRAMQLMITPKGEEVVDHIKKVFNSVEEKLLRGMTDEEIQTLRMLLFKVYDNLLE